MTALVSFNCVGCGVCCKGRFVPLSLTEAETWLMRGDDVVILLEAFATRDVAESTATHRHDAARSDRVRSGHRRACHLSVARLAVQLAGEAPCHVFIPLAC